MSISPNRCVTNLYCGFLVFLRLLQYTLEQSHGVPPVSVALDHTTLKEEGSCGYSSVKTVRSIVKNNASQFPLSI